MYRFILNAEKIVVSYRLNSESINILLDRRRYKSPEEIIPIEEYVNKNS